MSDSPFLFSKGTQLTVYLDNRQGTLAALAARDIHIECGYSAGGANDEKGLVLVPSDTDAARDALGSLRA